jgi:hypothetical protein
MTPSVPMTSARDPSLRLKNGYAQDDAFNGDPEQLFHSQARQSFF